MSDIKRWFDAEICIRKNATGEVRSYYDQEIEWADGGWSPWIWTDGNFSCDCNLALFFARASNEPDIDVACGEGAYTVLSIKRLEDGVILYEGAE